MIKEEPTKQEQIEALIHHQAYDLVMKYAPSEELDEEAYTQVFTVKRKDVLNYVAQHCQLKDLVHMGQSNRDGFYAIPVKGGFRVYEQYNTIKTEEQIITEELGVWKQFVDYVLRTSGTALDFD